MNYKYLFFLVLACTAFASCSKKTALTQKAPLSHYDQVKAFQDKLNEDYANPDKSPLSSQQIEILKANNGHRFFDFNESFKVIAQLNTDIEHTEIKFKTSTARIAVFRLYGIAHFELDGHPFKLNVYQSTEVFNPAYKDFLFLPFTDLTSGKSSYGGGRYIDIKTPKGNTLVIDFNKAYHPYCAYSDNYSCPVPPRENFVDYEIKAGVKTFEELERR